MTKQEKLPMCAGCRDNYYNQPGKTAIGCCYSLEKAEPVIRYRIGWWTQPTTPGAFIKVLTLSCHHAPGQYSHYKQLPDFVPGKTRIEQGEPL